MSSSIAQSYKWLDDSNMQPVNYYSNRFFSEDTSPSPTVTICITDGSSTNNVVHLFNVTAPSTTTSSKIDNAAVEGLIKTILNFSHFEENWDGYGGLKPDLKVIEDAISLIKKIPEKTLPTRAGISGDGEISLIWDKEALYADFGVAGDGTYCFFIKDKEKKMYGDDIQLSDNIPQEVKEILNK